MRIELWTDGAGNTGPCGWAYILRALSETGEVRREIEGQGFMGDSTNQRAELTAAIEGLAAITRPSAVVVHTDSAYVMNGFVEGWVERWRRNGWINSAKDPVSNKDLWMRLAMEVGRHEVSWVKVKGHSGVELNERVDKLAAVARLGELAMLEDAVAALA